MNKNDPNKTEQIRQTLLAKSCEQENLIEGKTT
jgi:hypothetical protein